VVISPSRLSIREQEVMNACWDDIDFVDGIFTVSEKADWRINRRHDSNHTPAALVHAKISAVVRGGYS